MKYRYNVVNNKTNEEKVIEGDDVNKVLQEVALEIIKIKKIAFYTQDGKKVERVFTENELKKLILDTKKELAIKTTNDLQDKIKEKKLILSSAINKKISVWEILLEKYNVPYDIPLPEKIPLPEEPQFLKIDDMPNINSQQYSIRKTIKYFFFKKKYLHQVELMKNKYENDLSLWKRKKDEIELYNKMIKDRYEEKLKIINDQNAVNLSKWETDYENYLKTQNENKRLISEMREKFSAYSKDSIEYYFKNLLEFSLEKNNFYEKEILLEYSEQNKILIVNFRLPSKEDIPEVKEISYVSTKDIFEEKKLKKNDFENLYESIIYQITLRSIYEIFFHDELNYIEAVSFNGFICTTDETNGNLIFPIILSIFVNRDNFLSINFEKIEVKSCFKALKGISTPSLLNITPILPIINLNLNDKRFINSRAELDNLNDTNLALMDWEDFEHLIRELFEKEFKSSGGEVKITRASRDGGVDAIAFDPDPIRGGKIIIQAKRYINTVGVSAVRDLYGTVLNEGATKGILVTTADYGTDAYEFAKGKPITLLNGSNLLYLLGKHGYSARIDLMEAKRISSQNKNNPTHK